MGLVAAFGTLPAQLAVLGCFLSVVGGLFLAYLDQEEERERRRNEAVESVSVPLALASDPEVYALYRSMCSGLTAVANRPGGILRDAAVQKLASVTDQVSALAAGKVVFSLTEEWRTVYERLLRSPELVRYRSVAWVQSREYWQDSPGTQSMQANFAAAARGVLAERIAILPPHLWKATEPRPVPEIDDWLSLQQRNGVRVLLAREAEVAREPDLLQDFGIYGTVAVGIQELDDHARTLRFTLETAPEALKAAESRWQRLQLYARPFGAEGGR
jgi:hypothetical protein